MDYIFNLLMSKIVKVKTNVKIGGASALVFGIICHIYVFTNLLLNHDSEWRLFYVSDNLALGRWSQKFFGELNTNFQIPAVIGMIALVLLALCVMIVIDFLEVSSCTASIIIAGLMTTFPVLACQFSYVWMADLYIVALFFTVISVKLTNYRYGWGVSVVLLALALGIYQAQFGFAVALFMSKCIIDILKGKSRILKQIAYYLAVLGTGFILYFFVLKILLSLKNVQLSNYQGVSSIGNTDIFTYIKQIPTSYQKIIQFFTNNQYLNRYVNAGVILIIAIFVAEIIFLNIKRRIYKSPVILIIEVLLVLLIPCGFNVITILVAGNSVHMLMIYPYICLPILIVTVSEIAIDELKNLKISKFLSFIVIMLLMSLIWNNYCVSNVAYLRLQVTYENSFAFANRVVSRIESLDGYNEKLPVTIVGDASNELYGGTIPEFKKYNSFTGTTDKLLFSTEPHVRTRKFFEHYIGIHMQKPSNEDLKRLNESQLVEKMPTYPKEGSIKIIDGIIVVKLSEGMAR